MITKSLASKLKHIFVSCWRASIKMGKNIGLIFVKLSETPNEGNAKVPQPAGWLLANMLACC